tara:strand:+ start:648 stop:3089 length:2442 start_codon:yes stop_codon:yes gene_type:complete
MNPYITRVLNDAEKKSASQPLFLQADTELLDCLGPIIEETPEIETSSILERLIEPEGQIMFRICWTNDSGKIHVNRGFQIGFAVALFASTLIAAEMPSPDAKPNRLINEQSPYLQQHAYNPVDWFAWSDEAFEKAKAENKVVLLSIGYSTCHWCHVMNRESFSNPETAAYLNEHFVCIKVDREERPDVDSVYMNFVQQLTGGGGWPLNVWLTPDRKPFYGGTYFPPDKSRGIRSATFGEVLSSIQETWTKDPASMLKQSAQIVDTLNGINQPEGEDAESVLNISLVGSAINAFKTSFNQRTGAFGRGPNFPSAANLSFLLKASVVKELDDTQRKDARNMALRSLDTISLGGIRDHIGGGFHRYTVDAEWKIPHYEKMLYDQATLVNAYLDAWLLTRDSKYRQPVLDTLEYLQRDMRHDQGGFFSAEDAESYESKETTEKREGAFYVWSSSEIASALKDDALIQLATAYFTLRDEGNAPSSVNSEDLRGYNTLRIEQSFSDLAIQLNQSEAEIEGQVAQIKSLLFEAQVKKPRPHLDDKIITSWNGLAISAFSRAAQILDEPSYADSASQAARFIKSNLFDPKTGQLIRLYREAPSTVEAFSDDYSYLIQGLIDLYEATANPEWLDWANELQETQIALFYDEKDGGFFGFQATDEIVFNQSKDSFDGAIPTSNSISAKNLARLGQFFDNADYTNKARQTVIAFLPGISQSPTRMPALVDAALYVIKKPIQIVVAAKPGDRSMLSVANNTLLPNRLLLHADAGASQAYLGKHLEFIQSANPIDGKATAFVCENFVCQLPARSPEDLAKQLNALVE